MKGLDPDHLAALESERDFLLRSLDDLEAEHQAGDIDAADFEELRDDYTRRSAEVLRAIDEQRAAFATVAGVPLGKQLFTLFGVLAVAAVAGLLLAQSVGSRSGSDSATGDIARSTAGLLAEAETLTFEREWDEAVLVYEEVLDSEPSNLEALTYRGWLQFQLGDVAEGRDSLAQAVATDPTYPDAHVFRALIDRAAGQWDDASASLNTLEGLEVPPEIEAMITGSNIRAEVLAEQLKDQFEQTNSLALDQFDVGINLLVGAADVLDEQESGALLALRVRDEVLAMDPTNQAALVAQGRRLATNPDIVATIPETALRGLGLLDQAIEQEPAAPEPRLWRAIGRSLQGDRNGANEDLDVLDGLDLAPEDQDLVDQMRAALSAG